MFLFQRKKQVGGGVLIYAKITLKPSIVDHFKCCDNVESVWIDINFDKGDRNKIRLAAFYRPPRQSKVVDLATVAEIEKGLSTNTIVMGDFNLPKLFKSSSMGSDWATDLFENCFEENFLTQLVKEPTRSNEMLDLILTSDKNLIDAIQVGETIGNSDHNIIRFNIKYANYRGTYDINTVRNYSKGDYNNIRSMIGDIDWKDAFDGLNAHEMWDRFKSVFLEAQNSFIPFRKLTCGKAIKPVWFTAKIQRCIKRKKKMFSRYKVSPTTENKEKYKNIRTKLKALIRQAKRRSEISLSKECKGDLKKFFSFYKFKNKEKRIGAIQVNGQDIHDDQIKVEIFNEMFSNVFTEECLDSLPKVETNLSIITNINITQEKVYEKIKSVKENKASGPDDISARVLKEAARELALPLFIIFKRSFNYTEIPEDWKIANIVPIFKSGSKTDPGNFRPVSLTSIVCKNFERIMKDQIQNYLENEELLLPSQHGFRSGRSCLTNLLDFFEYTSDILDRGKKGAVIYLDFCKAFDKVPHQRLVVSLKNHGIRGLLVSWIENWLSHRKQRVVLNGCKSSVAEVTSGVPQGTVLAPLLFIIFINFIDIGLTSKIWKFADDLKLAKEITSKEDIHQLQSDLNNLVTWTKEWQMKFNVTKCKVLGIGAETDCRVHIDGNYLETVTEEKDLGILVTKDMKSRRQTQEARRKGLKMLGILNRNVAYKNKEVIKRLYYAYVRPHLEYCIQAWHPVYKKDLDSLERVQRKATKMIRGFNNKNYYERLCSLNMFSLHYRRLRGDLIELFKIQKGLDKLEFRNMFKYNCNATRGHDFKLLKNQTRTRQRQSFFTQRVIDHWNSLPSEIIHSASLQTFRKKIDKHFTDKGYIYSTDHTA